MKEMKENDNTDGRADDVVDDRAESGDAQVQPEGHGELLALEPVGQQGGLAHTGENERKMRKTKEKQNLRDSPPNPNTVRPMSMITKESTERPNAKMIWPMRMKAAKTMMQILPPSCSTNRQKKARVRKMPEKQGSGMLGEILLTITLASSLS